MKGRFGCLAVAFIPLALTIWWLARIRVEPGLVQLASTLADPEVTAAELARAVDRALDLRVTVSSPGLSRKSRVLLLEGSGFSGSAGVAVKGSEAAGWLALTRADGPNDNRVMAAHVESIAHGLLSESRDSLRRYERLHSRLQEVPLLGSDATGLSVDDRQLDIQLKPAEGFPLILSTVRRREIVAQIGFLIVSIRGLDGPGRRRVFFLAQDLSSAPPRESSSSPPSSFRVPTPIAAFRSRRALAPAGALSFTEALARYRQEARAQGKEISLKFPRTPVFSDSVLILSKVPQADGIGVLFQTRQEKAQVRAVLPIDSPELSLLDRIPVVDPTSPALPEGALVLSAKLTQVGGVPTLGLVFDVTDIAFEWVPGGS